MTISTGMPHLDDSRTSRLDAFAVYVAVLPWFTTDVLHKLYLNVFQVHHPGVDDYDLRAITCADLIHSPRVRRIHYNMFAMHTDVQDALRLEMQKQPSIHQEIGVFMLAYAADCRRHFMSLKYLESYRVEGNLIVNPASEAGRIARHVVNRLNQIPGFAEKKTTVSYYLSLLNQNPTTPEQESLRRFLQGAQDYDESSGDIPADWKTMQASESSRDNTVTIRLPRHVRDAITSEIGFVQVTHTPTLYVLAIGINTYSAENIPQLQAPASDALKFVSHIMSARVDGREYNTRRLTDNKATRQAVIESINTIGEQMEPGDLFVFYFAGHGATEGISSETPPQRLKVNEIEDTALPVILCSDSLFGSTPGLAVDEIEHLLSYLPDECQSVIILDCEFTGTEMAPRPREMFTWTADPNIPDSYLSFDGILMYGTGEGQSSYESQEKGGHFTSGLLDALKRSNNKITYAELFQGSKAILLDDSSRPQDPYYALRGDFNVDDLFLKGFLTTSSANVDERIAQARTSGETALNLSGLNLTHFPEEILELTSLRILDISNNEITEVPDAISLLKDLNELNISDNKLRAFPHGVLQLTSLVKLTLSNNTIKWIPAQLKDLPVLGEIDLSGNPVLNLSAEMHQTSVTQLIDYFYEWSPVVTGDRPMVMVIGLDYDEKLRNIRRETEMIQAILGERVTCLSINNPSSTELFNTLLQYSSTINILHIAGYYLNDLRGPDDQRVVITDTDIVEMFKCIRSTRYPAELVVLNLCETKPLVDKLLDGIFNVIIGMEEVIMDDDALRFAEQFYAGLADGRTIEEAFEYARPKTAS